MLMTVIIKRVAATRWPVAHALAQSRCFGFGSPDMPWTPAATNARNTPTARICSVVHDDGPSD
jgi:hypothetical protein